MVVRERWMLCRTWLLGWEGLEGGALGAGVTSSLRVSFSRGGAEDGFWDPWLLWDLEAGCFFGITYVVFLTIRAPNSRCRTVGMGGACTKAGWSDFSGVVGVEEHSDAFCSLDLSVLSGSVSQDWFSNEDSSITGWKSREAAVEGSSGHWWGEDMVSVSVSGFSLVSSAVRNKDKRVVFTKMKKSANWSQFTVYSVFHKYVILVFPMLYKYLLRICIIN